MSRFPKRLTVVMSFLVLAIHSSAFGSSFKVAGNYAVGNHPVAIAAGDFNGDGKVDLAVANSVSKTVSVLLGNGDGTFGEATDYEIGVVPSQLVVTDLNGNGRVDIVVAEDGGTKVSVLLGNGNGSFESHFEMDVRQVPSELVGRLGPQSTYRSGTQTAAVVFADLNGDGQMDEAVSLADRNLVSVLLNVTEESKGDVNLIKNGGFETGMLLPWLQGRDNCSGGCKDWAVSTTDPRQGKYDAENYGNLELVQYFAATPTSSISRVVVWVRHPGGAINTAIDFFYSSGLDEEFLVNTSNRDWDSFDVTSDLASGESLLGLSVWGYGSGQTNVTFIDGAYVIASD